MPSSLNPSGSAVMSSMTRVAAAGALALALAQATLFVAPAAAQTPPALTNDMIEIEYTEPRSEKYKPIYQRLKDRKILEQLATFLSPLKLQGCPRLVARGR